MNTDAVLSAVSVPLAAVGAERDAVHHVPDRRLEPLRAADEPGARAMDGPQTAGISDRSGDPRGRTADASAEGRHPDDGRPADIDRVARADAALGRPAQRLRLDCGADDG